LFFITIIGIFTAFFSSTIGIFQYDIKKIIAYSTCSQLGYMVFICGLSNYSLSLFHLTNHAFFKALLFLSAGSIIHSLYDEQDIRKYGGLLKVLPFSYLMILIGSLSLMGIPFLTGFYSKDLIIEVSFSSYLLNNGFTY
jgi:NADH-ubiquinone oxidoreductase chain 5